MFVIMVGVFAAAMGFGIGSLLTTSSDETTSMIISVIIGLPIGALAAFITIKIFRPFMIIMTSIQASFIASYALFSIFEYEGWFAFVGRFATRIFVREQNINPLQG